MKKIIIYITFLLLSCAQNEKKCNFSLDSFEIKGNVEYISYKMCIISPDCNIDTINEHNAKNVTAILNRYFNKNGLITEIKYFNADSVLYNENKLYYTDNEFEYRTINDKQNCCKKSTTIEHTTTYIKEGYYDTVSNKLNNTVGTVFDSKGRIIRETNNDLQNENISERRYNYVTNDSMITYQTNYINGEKEEKASSLITLERDTNGNKIKTKQNVGNAIVVTFCRIKYY